MSVRDSVDADAGTRVDGREHREGPGGMRVARVNVRAAVRKVPGPCSRWGDLDADFIREVLDLVGDKCSVLIVGTLADGAEVRNQDRFDEAAQTQARDLQPGRRLSADGAREPLMSGNLPQPRES
jgi:hypothetical protein